MPGTRARLVLIVCHPDASERQVVFAAGATLHDLQGRKYSPIVSVSDIVRAELVDDAPKEAA